MTEDAKQQAREILRAIRQIMRRIAEESRAMSRQIGLTVPQFLCLKAVGELEESVDEITVAMVAERVHLSAATVSRVVERLVQDGIVTRERRSRDRRRVCLSLTDLGLERFQSLPSPLQEQFVGRLDCLPEGERCQLLASLTQVARLLEADELDAAPVLISGSDLKESGE